MAKLLSMAEDTTRLSAAQTHKQFVRFLIALFIFFPIAGVLGSWGYYQYVGKNFGWDATAAFHVGIIFWGVGFMAPGLIFSIRLMFHTLIMTQRGIENTDIALDRAGEAAKQGEKMAVAITDLKAKIEPIIKDLGPVVKDMRPVVKDAGSVIGKVSDLTKQLNGTLAPDTLKKIADAVEKGVDTVPKLRDWIQRQVPQLRTELEKHLYLMADDFFGSVLGSGRSKEEKPGEAVRR